MYSINNFIIPIGTDVVLKIRNTSNAIVYIIKEPTSTVSIKNNIIYIKQSADSTIIPLQFASNTEAIQAHILLRDSLKLLKTNIENANNNSNVLVNNIEINVSFLTTPGIDYTLNIPVAINQIFGLFVNGVLISNIDFSYTTVPATLTWKGTAPYVLEPGDIIKILYV